MRKYIKIAKSQMQVASTYSAWYWAGSASTVMQLLIMYFFWHAVYENRTSINSISLSSMLTYVVIAMLLSRFVSGVGNLLSENISNGNVAIELLRPYDLIFKMIAIDAGEKVTVIIREALPMIIVAVIFLQITMPVSFLSGILFTVSAVLGICIGTLFDFIVGVLAFWTINIWGLRVLKEAMVTFFSGALIPIILFPDWLKALSQYLPFQAMVYTPVSIYTGILTGTDMYVAIAMQIVWVAVLYIAVRLIWLVAMKKITIFGG
ncbi:hypothetical protein EJF36_05045 [Bacillus sp. HMF5848]|uniref:ABC transporter permease n=1 Tax=Bacillus sp. HMF5848 TaxID=2495421 RepID=UPI000F78DC30|nr:ABC-2 family transporter protein [Bacillus sp. HMF5848]RSK26274.1 hypothetical protein EJF36_05045 [Bacillus sp. HMF5848]